MHGRSGLLLVLNLSLEPLLFLLRGSQLALELLKLSFQLGDLGFQLVIAGHQSLQGLVGGGRLFQVVNLLLALPPLQHKGVEEQHKGGGE